MSIEISNCVWELDLPQNEKLVALALADHADKDGVCWPSMKRIAWKTGYGERQARTIIGSLITKGVLRVLSDRRGGRGNSNQYQLQPEKGAKLAAFRRKGARGRTEKLGNSEPERWQAQVGKAASYDTKAAVAIAEESSESSVESSGNISPAAPGFSPPLTPLLRENRKNPEPASREYTQDLAWLTSQARAHLSEGKSPEDTQNHLRNLITEHDLCFDDLEIGMVMRTATTKPD